MTHFCRYLSRALPATLALFAGNTFAQDDWYKVELLIIAHNPAEAGRSEWWNPTPVLAYPEDYRFITDANEAEDIATRYLSSRVDERGVQYLELQAPPIDDTPSPISPSPLVQTGPTDPLPLIEIPQREQLPTVENFEALRQLSWPATYTALEHSFLEFGDRARRLASGGGELLYHTSWVQPMSAQAEALPIIIDRSGDDGIHPRLQGSVTLYRSRYLHIRTNLWINTDGGYYDQDWRLPPPPLGPPSRVVTEVQPAVPSLLRRPKAAAQPEPEPIDPLFVGGLNDPLFGGDPITPEDSLQDPETGILVGAGGEWLTQDWGWRHAVTMRQSRRMRGGELHYLDHPLLGVVVKLTPLPPEDLDVFSRGWPIMREGVAGSAAP